MTQVQRYDWADFMRGLMMFMVVLYHSEVHFGNGHTWSWLFDPVFLTGFFFVSGYLFAKDIKHVSLANKFKQVFRGILFPYFCFMIILSLPKIALHPEASKQLLIDIFMMRASWFVVTVGVIQLLYAALLQVTKSICWMGVATVVFFLLGYAIVWLYRSEPSWLLNNIWLNSSEVGGKLPLCFNTVLVVTPFFYAGVFYRQYERRHLRIDTKGNEIMVISILMYVVLWCFFDKLLIGSYMNLSIGYYNNIGLMYLYAIIAIIALMQISKKIQSYQPINYIGKHSILFYFLNGGVLTIVSAIAKNVPFMNPENYGWQIVVAIIATAVMFPCVWFINKYIPVIAGNKNSFNNISKKLGLKINW